MKFDGTTLAASLELCIVLFCAFSIIYLRGTKNEQNRWLLFTYFAMGFPFLNLILGANRYGILPYTPFLQNPSPIILFFPAIYLYTLKLVKPNALSGGRAYLLFLPFVLFYWLFVALGFENPEELVYNQQPPIHIIIFLIANILHAIVYLYLTLRLVQFSQKNYQEQFAENSPFITLSWVKWMVYVIIITASVRFFSVIFPEYLSSRNVVLFSMVLFIWILNYFSFQQPTLYEDEPKLPTTSNENTPKATPIIANTTGNSTHHSLSDTEKAQLIQRLETYMQTEQPFLNTKIRMPELAKSLDIPRHVFSNLINEHYQMNFFHFINQYRVEYAKQLLINDDYKNYTLETIGELSGFNSRSTFNRIFKNVTGKSPKEFSASTPDNS